MALFFENPKPRILYIMGMSGSGKSTLAKTIANYDENKFKRIIQYTSRDKRENETDGIDYLFVSKESFKRLDEEGFFFGRVKKEFGESFYGTPISELDMEKLNIVVVSIEGFIDAIKKFGTKNAALLLINNVVPEVEREGRDASIEEKYSNILIDYIARSEPSLKVYKIDHSELKSIRNKPSDIIDILEEEFGHGFIRR